MTLRFAVLGPVRAWRDDTELTLGPPKQRALLALLLTQANRPVTLHDIVDVLWGDNPPDSAVNVIQRHIGELRRRLEPDLPARGASRWLVRGSGGYRLHVDEDGLDLLRFRTLRQRARAAADAGAPAEAAELLMEALGQWHGPVASGITPEIRSHPHFAAVDGEHPAAVKEVALRTLEAGPDLGARVLPTLRRAAARHPLDEVLQARLMLVLAATGHQAEALEVFRTVRARLVDELGVEPGPELLAAQGHVLRQTAATTMSSPVAAADAAWAPGMPAFPGAPAPPGPAAGPGAGPAGPGTTPDMPPGISPAPGPIGQAAPGPIGQATAGHAGQAAGPAGHAGHTPALPTGHARTRPAGQTTAGDAGQGGEAGQGGHAGHAAARHGAGPAGCRLAGPALAWAAGAAGSRTGAGAAPGPGRRPGTLPAVPSPSALVSGTRPQGAGPDVPGQTRRTPHAPTTPHAPDTGITGITGITGPPGVGVAGALDAGAVSRRAGQRAAAVRPAQLPPDLATFTGREGELASFTKLLPGPHERGPASPVRLICGMAGVGKTALAVHWAHRVADRFPDGQLYVDLRGFHPSGSAVDPGEVIRCFLEALGVPAGGVPAGLDAQTALYRSLLDGRRVLIVLDNARDSEHVRPLLPGTPGCLTIVTSRNQLYGLVARDGADFVTLNVLDDDASLEFLARRLGRERVERERAAAEAIVEACGRLPLALAVVSARAAMNPSFALGAIADELRESRGSLDAFSCEEPVADARSAFFWSYRLLSPEAARLFRLLGLHPGADCSLPAVASLAGRAPRRVRPALGELVRASLVVESLPGRYSCHELLRTYGAELAHEQGGPEEVRTARARVLDHYLHTVHAAERLLAPGWERLELPPAALGVTVPEFSDRPAAAEWLVANRPALLAAIEQDARHGPGRHAWQLATALERYLDHSGRWQEQLLTQSTAETAARRLGDRRGQAYAHRALGFVHGRLERCEEADRHLTRALELFAGLDDPLGEARAHRYAAHLANRRGAHDLALEHYRRATRCYRAAGRPGGEARVLSETGWTYVLMGRHEDALDPCRRAVELHRAVGDRGGEAGAVGIIGTAQFRLGRLEVALECHERAVRLYHESHDCYLEADALVRLGDTLLAAGRPEKAPAAWRRALGILEGLGHPQAVEVRAKLDSCPDRDAGARPVVA